MIYEDALQVNDVEKSFREIDEIEHCERCGSELFGITRHGVCKRCLREFE